MATYTCTGRSAAVEAPCDFTTNDEAEALSHFEAFDHDLERRELAPNPFNDELDKIVQPRRYVLTDRGRRDLAEAEADDLRDRLATARENADDIDRQLMKLAQARAAEFRLIFELNRQLESIKSVVSRDA